MSYLILDTDKQTTHSLRLLLSGISSVPILDAGDIDSFTNYSRKYRVPAEIVLLDLDGDAAKVKAFEEHLMLGRSPSSALIMLGSGPRPESLLKADRYIQKPVYIKNLKRALVEAQAKSQETRSSILFYGDQIPINLIRGVGRSPKLWKQILEIDSLPNLVQDSKELTQVGALFLCPDRVTEADFQSLVRLKKITSASRISLICLSSHASEIGKLRTVCDYYLSDPFDWNSFLDQLARTRLMRLGSSLNIDEAKREIKNGNVARAQRILTETLLSAPLKVEAMLLSGECDFLKINFNEARLKYQAVLALNPCLPKPYARLLKIESGASREAVLKKAIEYCPNVTEFQEGHS